MAEQGCDPNGNFTIILHGWEKSTTDWMAPTIRNFLKERGNCLFFMDFFFYSKTTYGKLFKNFAGISNVLLKKVKQIGNYENQLIYGFSIGARLAVDVGIKISSPKIGRLELCEPAGEYQKNFRCSNIPCLFWTSQDPYLKTMWILNEPLRTLLASTRVLT